MTLVIDYGAGNMRSVLNALDELGETPTVSDDPAAVAKAERIILPGVGAMKPAMARLRARGLDRALTDAVRGRDVPILGICLGMQMMCSVGHEGGEPVQGLGWIDGEVVLLEGAPPQTARPAFRLERGAMEAGLSAGEQVARELGLLFLPQLSRGYEKSRRCRRDRGIRRPAYGGVVERFGDCRAISS